MLERLHAERLPCNVALKLTHLGLELDEELAYANVERVVRVAERLGSFVRIDMEQSSVRRRDAPDLPPAARGGSRPRRHGAPVVSLPHGEDLESLLPLAPNLRFVKGAYLEPPEIAYTDKADVDAAYFRLVETALRSGAYAAIATHDEALIERCLSFAEHEGIGRDRFELQMLFGVRPALQLDLVRRGYRVLTATPYGPEWYPYLMRRLAERPANLGFFAETSSGADPPKLSFDRNRAFSDCPAQAGIRAAGIRSADFGSRTVRAHRTPRRGPGRGRSSRGARRAGREPARRPRRRGARPAAPPPR